MHIEKYKTMSSMTKSYNHNYRRFTIGSTSPGKLYDNFNNVQLDKVNLDKELISTYDGRDYAKVWRDKFNNMEFYKTNTLRKDAVRGLEFLLTMSHDMADKVNIDDWTAANVKWLQQTFGKENVESAMLHLDEATPHIHAFVLPILDKRFCAKLILGSPSKLRQMQNGYAKAMEPFGLDRGITGSHAKHEHIKYLHGEINSIVIKAQKLMKIRKNALGLAESIHQYATRISSFVEELMIRLHSLEKENKRLKQIQKQIIEKDKYYSNIQNNIENNKEIAIKAQKWMNIEKIMKNHPEQKVRSSYEKYVEVANKWCDKYERDELEHNNK